MRGPATSPAPTRINVFFASPILADGKLIVAGGALEQVVAGSPFYAAAPAGASCVALEPKTGKIVWKYDVGPKPEPLDPPITIKDSFGTHTFYFGPGDQLGLEHALVRRRVGHDLLRHRREHGAAAADRRRPAAAHARVVRRRRARRPQRHRAVGHADQPRRRLDQRHAVLRPEGGPVQGPVDRRHAQDLHDPGRRASRPRWSASAARTAGSTSCAPSDGQDARPYADLHRPADVSALAGARPRGCSPCRAASAACRRAARPTARRSSPTASTRLRLWPRRRWRPSGVPPTGGRVVAISLDTKTERWRHERPTRRHARRAAAQARVHRRRRPGRLGHRRGQRRRLLHRRRQRQAGRPRRRDRARSSRRSSSARSGRGPRSLAAASTSAPAIRCSPPPTTRPSSPRNTPACSTPSACPARTRSIGWPGRVLSEHRTCPRDRGIGAQRAPYWTACRVSSHASSKLLDLDVLEADFHRLRPDVDLERDDSLLVEHRVVAVDDPRAVEVDRHVRALGGDDELVPAVVLDQGLGLLQRVALEDAAAASPRRAGPSGRRRRRPAGPRPRRRRVRLLRNWMPELPLRILTLALSTKSPYDLSVTRNSFFLSVVLARPADDLAVLDREERLVVRRDPAGQVLAVEERVEALRSPGPRRAARRRT